EGLRSIVILIPGKKTGLVVIANKQLTAFPEAVRDEFLERYIGKSDIDLQERVKASQAGWNSLVKNPERPTDPGPATINPAAIKGMYKSDLYGTMWIDQGRDAGNMTIDLGPNKYPGNLTYWINNTWYLSWPNPDDMVGFVTFTANPSGSVTGYTSEEFGPFTRA
ncbi:MAG: hypothetical protein LUQ07_04940, partial [Methanospirillum sp.]|nr:hypothetical protein [Methanospirillum sp.]